MFSNSYQTPKILKTLILINVILFVLDVITRGQYLSPLMAMHTDSVLHGFQIWRVFTYMFLHDVNSIFHIFFNMLMLWMFGISIVDTLGEKKFLWLYLGAGVFAALCTLGFDLLLGRSPVMVGASGAVLAVMVAFALFFPEQELLFWGLFPIKAKWLILILVGIDLLFLTRDDHIARMAHLGGALYGFLFIRNSRFFENLKNILEEKRELRRERKEVQQAKSEDSFQQEVDKILKKISSEGMDSLTPRERRILERASRKKKEKSGTILDIEKYRSSYRDRR